MANRWLNQFYYSFHKKPVQLDCSFTVDSADSGGYGLTGLSGSGIQNVYMHTSSTPAGAVNPAAGYIYVKLQDNYNAYYFGGAQVQAPVTGSAINISDSSVLTVGVPYQIVTVGTSTSANWQTVGLPVGTTPAAGVVFLAKTTGSGTGTGTVKALGVSGICGVELMGTTSLMIKSSAAAVAGAANGSYMVLKCLGPTFTGSALSSHSHALLLKNAAVADGATTRVNAGTNLLGANTGSDITVAGGGANGGVQTVSAGTPAGTVTYGAVAPADGSVIRLSFLFSSSSIVA